LPPDRHGRRTVEAVRLRPGLSKDKLDRLVKEAVNI
jgi:hypothetical protein